MGWTSELLRSRLRVPMLWVLIACLLMTGIFAVVSHGGDEAATKARAGEGTSNSDGMVSPTPDGSGPVGSVAAGIPGTTAGTRGSSTTGATRGTAPGSNSATNGTVTVTWGPGTVNVSWIPFASGARSFEVVANEAGAGYSGTLVSCGTCLNVTFKGLMNGGRYTFTVTPVTGSGDGKAVQSPVALPNSDLCPPGPVCVAVDSGTPTGSAQGRAQGFLHGIDEDTDASRISALKPQFWRGSGGPKFESLVKPYDVVTTHILSDYWIQGTYDQERGGAPPPWEDWQKYRNGVSYVVKFLKDKGVTPWWEIQNEPDAGYPYVPGTQQTIENTLAVYKNAYAAIKAVDPNAKILGPSLSGYTIEPMANHPGLLDMTTFLDYANSNHLMFDAISLHETGAEHLAHDFDKRPEAAQNHVARLQDELFKWPNIGHPKIFMSEYSSGRTLSIPGWQAAYLAAAEAAGVESASGSCWFDEAASCTGGTLDGLLDADKTTPRATYWVRRAYADMRGTRIDTSDPVPWLSAFAVAQGARGPWLVLLGRDQSCTSNVNPQCPPSATPAPTRVTVAVRVGGPDRTLTATVERIPSTYGTVPDQPPAPAQSFTVRGGVGRVVLPAFADGEAYYLRIS